jgi:hypothetical protein
VPDRFPRHMVKRLPIVKALPGHQPIHFPLIYY